MTQIDKSRFEWIGSDSARREGISRPSTTFWKDAIGRLMKNKVAVVCFFIIVLLILPASSCRSSLRLRAANSTLAKSTRAS